MFNPYGTDKLIRKNEVWPETTLPKRLAPLSKKVDTQTVEFRTYRLPITALRRRAKNSKDECVFDSKNIEHLSYLPNDIPFSYKNPRYWKSLKRDNGSYATLSEAFETDPDEDFNEVFIFSSFNLLSKYDFYDKERGGWIISNSTELENCIDCSCLLDDTGAVIFDKNNLFNIEEKRKTVKGTEKGLYTHINIANEGPKINSKNVLVPGENQYLPFNCLIEWFVPYFDNETRGHGFLYYDEIKKKLVHDKKWLKTYEKCLPKEYRGSGRVTLMYRRYDERRENDLVKEYAYKSAFLNFWFKELIGLEKEGELQEEGEEEEGEEEEPIIEQPVLTDIGLPKPFVLAPFDIEEKEEEDIIYQSLEIITKFILNLKEEDKKYVKIKSYMRLSKSIFDAFKKSTKDVGMEKSSKSIIFDFDDLNKMALGPPWIKLFLKNYKLGEIINYKLEKPKMIKYFTNIRKYKIKAKELKFMMFKTTIQKKIYTEFSEKLYNMRRKIFARVMKEDKHHETVWSFLSFKEPSK